MTRAPLLPESGLPGGRQIGPSVKRRAVLLVANPAAPYSRGLRVARSLAERGWDVEIAAVTGQGQPLEEHDGAIVIRRYRPSGGWAHWSLQPRAASSSNPLARFVGRGLDRIRKVVFWPLHVRGWWATLRRELAPADLYHAFGILTIPIAEDLGRAARRRDRAGRVVYDVIDVILDSNNYALVPGPVRAFYKWRERRWVRRADAVVTVNDPIAAHLVGAWRLRTPPTVLLNCQPRWNPPAPPPDRLRDETGIPPDRAVVLFLGRLGRERGLDEAAEAVLQLENAALVLLGFGPWADTLRARDRQPRFAGHHYTLPPVHPDDLPTWTASADVSIIAVPANSLNQRLSTPNKFWESLTAGTPVVVGWDLEVMRSIVLADGLGAVADPSSPDDLARALHSILDRPMADRLALRDRCRAITRERYNWETAVGQYLELVDRLVPVT